MKGDNDLLRFCAAATLPSIDPENCRDAVPFLLQALKGDLPTLYEGDSGQADKSYLIETFERMGPQAEEAIPTLESLVRFNKEPGVKEAAEKALKAIRGAKH